MSNANDFNAGVIAEFRDNGGKVGGPFEGANLLILYTTGAKSGEERLNPLMYRREGDEWVVFASNAGSTSHPDWYHNILADPSATIEVGTEKVPVRARVTEGDERDRIWESQKREIPQFAGYEETAGDRQIPVVALSRA